LGHRRSVAETIAWRFPSARERPGAGYLPILALGRLRARQRTGVGALVTLWRRAPREVYRVYREEEYLADEDQSTGEAPHPTPVQAYEQDSHSTSALSQSPGSRAGRLFGFGLLTGVTIGVAGLVVLNASHRFPSTTPRGVPQSTPARSSSSPRGAHFTSGDVSIRPETAVKRSAANRPEAWLSMPQPTRRPAALRDRRFPQSRAVTVSAQPRTQEANAPLPGEQVTAVSSIGDEFGFES
jgi:hypothetical protein